MYGAVYSAFVDFIRKEGFAGDVSTDVGVSVLALLMIALMIFVQLFIVQFLWNTVLVRVVSGVKPIPSLLYTLGFLVLVGLVLPG
jgi:hypothetical protein